MSGPLWTATCSPGLISSTRLINVELRKETSGLESQVKVLESELKIHQAEVQELRDVSIDHLSIAGA